MSTPLGTTLSVEHRKLSDYLTKPRTCVRCQLTYTELNNLGTHLCAFYHPRMCSFDVNGRYMCCGRTLNSVGCVAADHTEGAGDKVAKDDSELISHVTSSEVLFMASLAQKPLKEITTQNWHLVDGVWNVDRVDINTRRMKMAHIM